MTYVVFPALIWAAFRFGPPGATLSIAIAAGVAIGVTANDVGPFFKQPIDHRTLSTQVYIVVAALTTLFLSAVVSERERAATAAGRGEAPRGRAAVGGAPPDRARPARLRVPGAVLDAAAHAHGRRRRWRSDGARPRPPRGATWGDRGADPRPRRARCATLIFELGRDPLEDGLVAALAAHAASARPGRTGSRSRSRRPRAVSPSYRALRRSSSASGARRSPTSSSTRGASDRLDARRGAPAGPGRARDRATTGAASTRRGSSRPLRPRVDAQPRRRDRRRS